MTWTKEDIFISNSDGIKLKFATLEHPTDDDSPRQCITLITGWKETFYKYEPLLTELHTRGFNIFTMDHRNQGLSEDTPGTLYEKGNENRSGRRICYVNDFDSTYVRDVRQFLESIVRPSIGPDASICLLSHSMGGLISARVAQLQVTSDPDNVPLVDRMVMSSPMMLHKNVLDLGKFDLELPIGLASVVGSIMSLIGQGKTKADGRDTDSAKPTTEKLSHCSERGTYWNKVRERNPNAVLAGASFAWAKAALKLEQQAMKDACIVDIPTLVFIAENDSFVYGSHTIKFVDKIGKTKALSHGPIANSYHELLNEKNDIVNPIIDVICAFASVEKEENFPKSVMTALDKVPLSETKFDRSIRIPPTHHSGWYPPSMPSQLSKTS